MKSPPAKKIYHAAMLWATANGKKYFTVREQHAALRQYLLFLTHKN